MLSRGKIQESGGGEAAEAALRKMALLDTTAIPLDLLSSTERQAVLVLKQHALVTVDDKECGDTLADAARSARPDGQGRSAGARGGRRPFSHTTQQPSLSAAGTLPKHVPPRRKLPRGG